MTTFRPATPVSNIPDTVLALLGLALLLVGLVAITLSLIHI